MFAAHFVVESLSRVFLFDRIVLDGERNLNFPFLYFSSDLETFDLRQLRSQLGPILL